MWGRAHVGFGGTGSKRKAPARNNASGGSTARATRALAEASPPKLLNTAQGRRDAPKVAILEAPCAQNAPGRSTMRPPDALLPRNPTWESSHFSGLTRIVSYYDRSLFLFCYGRVLGERHIGYSHLVLALVYLFKPPSCMYLT